MATARVFNDNLADNPNPVSIVISSTGASPATCIIANGQGVAFSSNGPTVNITFAPDAVSGSIIFNNVTNLGPSTPQTVYPLVTDRTVNYNTDGSTVFPYAIQVGAGPLFIKVASSVCTPDPAVIPAGGTIEMVATDHNYNVTWNASNGDPFNPALTAVYLSGNPLTVPHTAYLPAKDYSYSVSAMGPTLGTGGGKVKIKGT
jgi:hypothetical protein